MDPSAKRTDVFENASLPSFGVRALGGRELYLHHDREPFFFSSGKTTIQSHAVCSFPASLRFELELHEG